MSLKAEIETWVKALECFDTGDNTQALAHFSKIADSSRILFNVGLVHANMGDHRTAIVFYDQAQRLDQYFALSFFQCGVSFFLLQKYEAAAQHFQDAYTHLRENAAIDYEQIGLKFKLYSAEILFNQALVYLRMNQTGSGMQLLEQASREKQIPEHDVIDQAIAAFGRDFTVFSLPSGMLFRPSDLKVKNLKAKNYLGRARLVAATSPVDAFVGFSGTGAKSVSSSEPNLSTLKTEKKRQSPNYHSRSPSAPNFPMSITKRDEPAVAPLKLLRKKSSIDLRDGAGSMPPPRPLRPGDPNAKLPRINTNLYGPVPIQRPSIPASSSSPSLRTAPTISAFMPPTPPDSDSGRKNLLVDRRDTAITTLVYLSDSPYAPPPSQQQQQQQQQLQRDPSYMDDLISEYSVISVVDGFPGQPSPPAPAPLPLPNSYAQLQDQANDRVANWAVNQRRTPSPETSVRYNSRPSAPPSTVLRQQPSTGTLRRYNTRRYEDMQRLRSGSLDDHISPTLASNQTLDDLLAARSGEMLSIRLKLHFEDEIRGMSLDSDTPWPEFYARLQSKFGIANMSLKYKDEDGTFITVVDEDDWNSAIDAARENCRNGRLDGKLDIWIIEGATPRRRAKT